MSSAVSHSSRPVPFSSSPDSPASVRPRGSRAVLPFSPDQDEERCERVKRPISPLSQMLPRSILPELPGPTEDIMPLCPHLTRHCELHRDPIRFELDMTRSPAYAPFVEQVCPCLIFMFLIPSIPSVLFSCVTPLVFPRRIPTMGGMLILALGLDPSTGAGMLPLVWKRKGWMLPGRCGNYVRPLIYATSALWARLYGGASFLLTIHKELCISILPSWMKRHECMTSGPDLI